VLQERDASRNLIASRRDTDGDWTALAERVGLDQVVAGEQRSPAVHMVAARYSHPEDRDLAHSGGIASPDGRDESAVLARSTCLHTRRDN
jgi:hypothetical protein